MVDPWKLEQSKKLVREILAELSAAHCPDCGSGHVRATFRLSSHGGLEYYTLCPNCRKQTVY